MSQPSEASASTVAWSSTPSATRTRSSECASSRVEVTIDAARELPVMAATKDRSSFSSLTGSRRR